VRMGLCCKRTELGKVSRSGLTAKENRHGMPWPYENRQVGACNMASKAVIRVSDGLDIFRTSVFAYCRWTSVVP